MARLDKYGRVVFVKKMEVLMSIGSTQNEDNTWTPAINGRGLVHHLEAFDMEDNTRVPVGVETPDLEIMETLGYYVPQVADDFAQMEIIIHEKMVSQEYIDAHNEKYSLDI